MSVVEQIQHQKDIQLKWFREFKNLKCHHVSLTKEESQKKAKRKKITDNAEHSDHDSDYVSEELGVHQEMQQMARRAINPNLL